MVESVPQIEMTGRKGCPARKAGCVAALLFFAGIGAAQTGPAASISNKAAGAPQAITYADGQLKINVLNTTLADVLGKVAALTGVTIDIPPGAVSDRMQIVELGPGPARQILASLLSESNFDYLIQSSDNDQEKIQSVLLMPRGKKDSTLGGIPAPGRPFGNPYGRAAATPAPPPEEPPAPVVPDNLPAGLVPVNPQSPPVLPEQLTPTQPDAQPLAPLPSQEMSVPLPPGLSADPSNRPGALTPPPVMNQQSINQQLQQMYQQRVQILQQDRQGSGTSLH